MKSSKKNRIGIGVGTGMIIGIIIGSIFDNVGLGVALGIIFGAALGSNKNYYKGVKLCSMRIGLVQNVTI